MTPIILFITKIILVLTIPASIILLTLKAVSVLNISWLIVFLPAIIASMMITLCVGLFWLELTLAKFD